MFRQTGLAPAVYACTGTTPVGLTTWVPTCIQAAATSIMPRSNPGGSHWHTFLRTQRLCHTAAQQRPESLSPVDRTAVLCVTSVPLSLCVRAFVCLFVCLFVFCRFDALSPRPHKYSFMQAGGATVAQPYNGPVAQQAVVGQAGNHGGGQHVVVVRQGHGGAGVCVCA